MENFHRPVSDDSLFAQQIMPLPMKPYFDVYLFFIVDMMVKKNLAYVNSQDLDKMDILTSDLDVSPEHLHVEVCLE